MASAKHDPEDPSEQIAAPPRPRAGWDPLGIADTWSGRRSESKGGLALVFSNYNPIVAVSLVVGKLFSWFKKPDLVDGRDPRLE